MATSNTGNGFTPVTTSTAARGYADIASGRQVRDVTYGGLLTHSRFPYLTHFGGSIALPGEDGKVKAFQAAIKSIMVGTMTPEIEGDEVGMTAYSLSSDVSVSAGASATLVVDSSDGLEVGRNIAVPEAGYQGLITAISGTSLTVTCLVTGVSTLSAGTFNIKALGSSFEDARDLSSIVGVYRNTRNISGYLQKFEQVISQGNIQKALQLYGNPSGDGVNQDWLRRQQLALYDINRQREEQHVFSLYGGTVGSGASKKWITKGMLGWVLSNSATVVNPNEDGALTWGTLTGTHMAAARASGGPFVVYAYAGTQVQNVITELAQKQNRRVDSTNEKYTASITSVDMGIGELRIVRADAMDHPSQIGNMITYVPETLERRVLRGYDFRWSEDKENNSVDGMKGSYSVVEGLLPKMPEQIVYHKGILKAGA